MDIKALSKLATDQIMSYAELKEDNVFSKIPKKDIKKYIIALFLSLFYNTFFILFILGGVWTVLL